LESRRWKYENIGAPGARPTLGPTLNVYSSSGAVRTEAPTSEGARALPGHRSHRITNTELAHLSLLFCPGVTDELMKGTVVTNNYRNPSDYIVFGRILVISRHVPAAIPHPRLTQGTGAYPSLRHLRQPQTRSIPTTLPNTARRYYRTTTAGAELPALLPSVLRPDAHHRTHDAATQPISG
jgi:hypothetical protein